MLEEILINLALMAAGFLGAFINVMAGAGSIVVLTTMLFLDIPSLVALSTFRVALVFQSFLGANMLHRKHKKIDLDWRIFVPILIGSAIGAHYSAFLPHNVFDYLLTGVIVFVALFVVLHHHNLIHYVQIPLWLEFLLFLVIGFYGGFVQVGTGFLLLAGLHMVKKQDLISANATKLLITMVYSVVAVAILAYHGKIYWHYAPALVIGGCMGSYVSCHLALRKGESFAKVLLLVAVAMSMVKLVVQW